MPIVELHLLQGYGSEEKRRLHEGLTDAVRLVVPALPDAITVLIHEMEPDNYSRGRKHRVGAPALKDPGNIVKRYLKAMEARDFDSAQSMLGEGFSMQFPGAEPMVSLKELLDWAGPRYRFVKKTYDGFDVMQSSGPEALVYCRGNLSGEWPDGTAFDSIRFIDRFEIEGEKIMRQDVWNDIAEARAKA
ncbi:4-oxalocrotonate tautomerase family enzyme [Labrenzia sp. EL_208]|uniref:tautomerase family protein n=1 Tax=Roseibium album TaxID=311410 RepID=UPI000CF024B0|nr:4-oxalocrotonate tautomerase family enzyme [Labrenzia sp. EL_142]MBG6174266.1 4-oxalocrotonate tautomerase family enzyme [Labrenzia sp. EL_132]MBG6228278.1 4-oxalocrotonate tautomerase family enzyme [Labrenzia sp. EL_208]